MNTVFRTHFLRPAVTFALAVIVTAMPARATLLVYEGFNGYTAGQLATQNPNANTIGLNQSVGYYDDAATSRAAGFTLTTGLSFGSLATNGGAMAYTSGTNVIGADIALGASPFTGTLWTSYLVKISTQGSGAGDGSLFRVGDSPADTADIRYTSFADSRSSSTTVATSYSTASGSNGTASLTVNTTYIIIASFTRVGSSLTAGNPGVATLRALNEAQFATFLASGGDEAALLGTTVTATATHSTTSGTFTFVTGDATSFVTVNGTGVFDELRIGSSLADVTPTAVPEPSTTAFIVGISCGLFFLNRRESHRR